MLRASEIVISPQPCEGDPLAQAVRLLRLNQIDRRSSIRYNSLCMGFVWL